MFDAPACATTGGFFAAALAARWAGGGGCAGVGGWAGTALSGPSAKTRGGTGALLRLFQTGYVGTYAFWLVIGVLALLGGAVWRVRP